MTSLPPPAAGPRGHAEPTASAAAADPKTPQGGPPGAGPPRPADNLRSGAPRGYRSLPPIRPSSAPIELTLDLRATPPDKALARLFGALERVAADVTLLVLFRDTPEYVGVVASASQALRARGYVSDTLRFPPGAQRMRVQHRPEPPVRPPPAEREPETVYAPPPAAALSTADAERHEGTSRASLQSPPPGAGAGPAGPPAAVWNGLAPGLRPASGGPAAGGS